MQYRAYTTVALSGFLGSSSGFWWTIQPSDVDVSFELVAQLVAESWKQMALEVKGLATE